MAVSHLPRGHVAVPGGGPCHQSPRRHRSVPSERTGAAAAPCGGNLGHRSRSGPPKATSTPDHTRERF